MEKRIMLVSAVFLAACLGVSASASIGTPTAGLGQGQWSLGFDYTYSTQDLDKIKMKGSDESEKYKNRDFNVNRYYGVLSYGLTEEWEVSAKVGIADVKTQLKGEGDDEWSGHNFDNDIAWGWGTKVTFLKQEKCDWGASLQMNWLNTSWDQKYEDGKESIDIDTYDLLIAVGPTVDMGGWKLYGGPFFYYLSGDVDWKGSETDEDDGLVTWKESGDLRAKSNFGGYIGAQFELAKNWDAGVEFSLTGDGWGLGTGITFKF